MRVGDTARRSRGIRERDIELFTELTGDRNPLHYDDELAERSRFGGLIVQGGVTSGLLNAVVAEDLPGPGSVFLQVDWSFRAPVRPGDVITAEVEVLELPRGKADRAAADDDHEPGRRWSCSTAPRSSGASLSARNSHKRVRVRSLPSERARTRPHARRRRPRGAAH